MMFKVGDKVVGNKNHYPHRQGKFGVVSEVNFSFGCFGVIWEDDGETHLAYESEIDLVEPAKEENPVTTFKPGDKINWKWKKDKWGDNPEWQERIYTVNEEMTKACHDDGGFIILWDYDNNDYRLVEPAEDKTKMTKFKVGDRVKIINGGENNYLHLFPVGSVGYIVSVLVGDYEVKVDDETFTQIIYESDLEAYTEGESMKKTWGEMSPEEKGALLLAHHEGKTIEYSGNPSISWLDTFGVPTWGYYVYYRVKPEETPKEPEREVVAFKTQGHTYIKVEDNTFTNYSYGETAMYDNLAVFKYHLPNADEVFYKGDTISFVL